MLILCFVYSCIACVHTASSWRGAAVYLSWKISVHCVNIVDNVIHF